MKCPLFCIGDYTLPAIKDALDFNCIQEECGWWEKVHGVCGVLALYQELRLLVGAITMIIDKMPPAPTIRK